MKVTNELIDRCLDGDASAEDIEALQQWLEVPENLDQYARRAELHSDLRRSLSRRRIQSQSLPFGTIKVHDQVRSSWLKGALAIAVSVILVISFWRFQNRQVAPSEASSLVTVVSEIDAVIHRESMRWTGVEITPGNYELRQGLLHLRFDGEVMVYVEAPAEFDVVSGKNVLLRSGRLSANVPPTGVGFTVDTPEAEVVDFGTEFSVEVADATSEVHVFNGLVRVQPRANENTVKDAIDLRTAEAIRIDDSSRTPVGIALATNRFIRNFDEPKRRYARSIKKLSPVAFYRMPIRDRGLVAEPAQYSGSVLTGEGARPPHARGMFMGGSLRVRADSVGRGGIVESPPPLQSGTFTLAVIVYLEASAPGSIIASNQQGTEGNFTLSLDPAGRLKATMTQHDGQSKTAVCDEPLAKQSWIQVVMTSDGDQLNLYQDARMVASVDCGPIAVSSDAPIGFGTPVDFNVSRDQMNRSQSREKQTGDTDGLWNGRIDELAIFDKALTAQEIADLYRTAMEQINETFE